MTKNLKAAGVVLDHGLSAGIIQQHQVGIDPRRASPIVFSIRSTWGGLTPMNFDPNLDQDPS